MTYAKPRNAELAPDVDSAYRLQVLDTTPAAYLGCVGLLQCERS